MSPSSELLKQLARESAMLPQEQMLEVGRRKKSLFIGIPKEITFQEHRVPLTPVSVSVLVGRGHEVVIERGAGQPAQFQDSDYSEAGAHMVDNPTEVFKADIILKVAPPSHNEIEMLRHKQILISALQLTVQPKDTLRRMMEKRMTAVAWDFIKDREGIYPIIRAMGEIAGNTSIQIAAEYLSTDKGGQGLMLGGISGVAPAEVVIIGAGTVGEFATRAALGLGASVKVFDKSIYRLRRLQNDLGVRVWTSVIQPDELKNALRNADVAIGALRPEHGRTPMVVSEEMVKEMANNSVIVDVSIDRGGCFETSEVTTHTDPVYKKYGVIHYCVPNIASRVPRTASTALSNIFTPMIQSMGDVGGFEDLIKTDLGVRHGVYLYNGTVTSPILGESFKLPYKDLDILLAAFYGMDLKRRLQLYLIGLIIGGTASYFIFGERLTNSAWTPEQKLKQRLRSTLVSASPSAVDQLATWPADLALLRASLDSANIDLGASRRTDDSIYYHIETRISGRAALMTVAVLRDFDKDSTATLLDLRSRP